MKKSRLIALTLVMALMLMGTAYAAWTQTVNVTNTVSTGTLDVTLEADAGSLIMHAKDAQNLTNSYVNQEGLDLSDIAKADDSGVVDVANIQNDKRITFTGTNFIPNSYMNIRVKLTGNGDIPADINLKNISENFPLLDGPNEGSYDVTVTSTGEYWDTADHLHRGVENSLSEALNSCPQFTLEQNEVLYIDIFFNFDYGVTENTLEENRTGSENYSLVFDVDVSQFNIDLED